MNRDIGKILKRMAYGFLVCFILSGVVGAFAFLMSDDLEETWIPAIGILLGGCAAGTFFWALLTGFGELVDRAISIDEKLERTVSSSAPSPSPASSPSGEGSASSRPAGSNGAVTRKTGKCPLCNRDGMELRRAKDSDGTVFWLCEECIKTYLLQSLD